LKNEKAIKNGGGLYIALPAQYSYLKKNYEV